MATKPTDHVRKEMLKAVTLRARQRFGRWIMRVIMASFFALAGIVHLYAPDAFLAIVPDWVPEARNLILIAGLCEIAGAIALLTPRLQNLAGYMLAAYAICVFPANIKHAFYHVNVAGLPDSWWYHAPRLALQPVIVWWALFSAECIDWPFPAKRAAGGIENHSAAEEHAEGVAATAKFPK